MSASRTPWFGLSVKPVHWGLYERSDLEMCALWDGRAWWLLNEDLSIWHLGHCQPTWPGHAKWRGLTKEAS